ncbi:MAG: hypothetical protein RL220_550 [Bacteroidota bacterium]
MVIKACLFDLDGVIVDTAKYHFMAWHRLADKMAIPFTEAQNEQLKGVSRVDSLEKLLSWGGIVLDNLKKMELLELKNQWYLNYVENMPADEILPGVKEFLTELRDNDIRVGLGSSSKNAPLILDKLGITSLFDTVVDGNRVHFSKPHPEVFLRGARDLGVKPEETVVFEDALSGVEAALAGNFRCIGIGEPNVLNKAHAVIPALDGMSVARMKELLG